MSKNSYKQEPWSLDELFPALEGSEVREALAEVEALVQEFETFRARLALELEPAVFQHILQAYEQLVRLVARLGGFGYLHFSADTQNQQIQAFLARIQQLSAEADNRTLFFKLWWKELDEEAASRLLPVAGDLRYWLETLRLERPYTLSEAEERVINLKNVNGPYALLNLFTSLTSRYAFKLAVNGELKEFNREELQVYFRHPDPELRAAAYQELLRVWQEEAPILGQIYQYRVRDWYNENVSLRSFSSPIAVRNLYNDVPNEVVDILLDVCRANAPLFQRYFRLKAHWLGVERLRRYDLYAPVAEVDKSYPYAEAVELVLDSFHQFDPGVASLGRRVFDKHHVDGEVRKGKQDGAFCLTIGPDLTPWILQTYNGRVDDVATLAHELGHAVHALLADHHAVLTQQASLPLAETASTFAEMLVTDRLLAENPDPDTRRAVLFRQMDIAYATIGRQAYFALFEREAHDLIRQGAAIDDLSRLYARNLADQFGEALAVSDDFQYEWLGIPHFYASPFYVYAYAFGQLLVFSLYQQYQEEGEAFKPRYLAILSAGGSDSPATILERAGIDMYAHDFWQGGFDVIQEMVEQLEALERPH
ncbi:MAG: M3 family oligoendopeptidase [Chloroflexi bacterium]|nr:M3 family oligoendopeptidase [Chloroflexota bacterium]MCI0648562.1 M3 family oligoendopeptidase [Chloroflexota bacterium]MCI0727325.1 M3 family oligoendopeptidase [Chloroflexota bacterium]